MPSLKKVGEVSRPPERGRPDGAATPPVAKPATHPVVAEAAPAKASPPKAPPPPNNPPRLPMSPPTMPPMNCLEAIRYRSAMMELARSLNDALPVRHNSANESAMPSSAEVVRSSICLAPSVASDTHFLVPRTKPSYGSRDSSSFMRSTRFFTSSAAIPASSHALACFSISRFWYSMLAPYAPDNDASSL